MNTIDKIKKAKIIPVIKIDDLSSALPLFQALKNGGLSSMEITYRGSCAKDALAMAIEKFPNMLVGAGTVVNVSQAKEAIELGVKFVVSPGFDDEIAFLCKDKNIPYFGGCVTPTEIMKAKQLGINIVKFFPAEAMGGLKTIKSLAAPFPDIEFMPTGGINMKNIREYLSFEKVIACGGSWMVKSELIKNRDFEKITKLCKEALTEVRDL